MKLNRILAAAFFSLILAGAAVAQQQPPAPPQNPPAQAQQPPQKEAQKEAVAVPAQPAEAPAEKAPAKKLIVPSGTRLPLVMHNALSTRSAKAGDPLYLETTFPVIQDGRVIIPAGSYISGEVVSAKRPGKVKGRAEMMIRLTTLILPNGYAASFNAIPTGAGTGANDTVEEEGKIKGDTDKGGDAGTIIRTTTLGTGVGGGIGASTGHPGTGIGIGAAAGAAAGLLWTLLSRGPELDMPRGTSLDIVLDRPLYLDDDKINFTDPGRASSLAGPPNNRPVRNRFPF